MKPPPNRGLNRKGEPMIRNLKVLGVALAAVFALSAVAAAAASAQVGTFTSTGPWTLTATENAGQLNGITAFGLDPGLCPGSTYTFHKLNETPHKFIPNDVSQVTVTPHYKQPCITQPGNFPTTIDMNDCDYAITLGTTTATGNQYNTTFHVVCQGTNQITTTIFTNATKHAENKPFCKLHMGTQSNLTGATAKDNLNGTIQINGTIKGVTMQRTNGGEDPLLCAASQTTQAELHINITASGKNEIGSATSVSLSHL
jgi:hypothetical protein